MLAAIRSSNRNSGVPRSSSFRAAKKSRLRSKPFSRVAKIGPFCFPNNSHPSPELSVDTVNAVSVAQFTVSVLLRHAPLEMATTSVSDQLLTFQTVVGRADR